MIINLGDSPFKACIKVTYPRGTCSCSSDKLSLSHSGGGTATFTVRKKAQYTIKIATGSLSKTESVSIERNGQTVSVSLDYKLYLVKDGAVTSAGAGMSTANKWFNGDTTYGTGNLYQSGSTLVVDSVVAKGATGVSGITSSTINLNDYVALSADVSSCSYSGPEPGWFYLNVTDSKWWGGRVAVGSWGLNKISNNSKLSTNISSVTGSHYIQIAACHSGNTTAQGGWVGLTNVYLE